MRFSTPEGRVLLQHFLLPGIETNCYLLGCEESREAAVIDPGQWPESMEAYLQEQGFTLTWALLTHGHADHTGGLREILRRHPVQVAGHSRCPGVTLALGENQTIKVGNVRLEAIEVLGHTPDSLAYRCGRIAFVGDTLFAGSIGGTSDRTSYEQLTGMIHQKLWTLGDDVLILPGHGPATTVQIERLYNPFLLS